MIALIVTAVWRAWQSPLPTITAAPRATTAACQSVAQRWPAAVAGQSRRLDDAGIAAAAWGDPAIIARCGVAALAPTSDECVEVDGIGWVVHPLSDGTRLTSYGSDPAIEVLVPRDFDPAPLLMPAFGPAAQSLPTNGRHCR